MIQYLVILLDDTSTSFCHYENPKTERRLMPLDVLKAGILYGMKENLNIQFVYPDYDLPQEYKEAIDTIDHTDIKPASVADDAEVVVFEGWDEMEAFKFTEGTAYVLRTSKADLFANYKRLCLVLGRVNRLNVILTDEETFTENDFKTYKTVLGALSAEMEKLYLDGKFPQLNLLTDRMMLDKMNNCGAGDTTITLAPDGKFYVCPAFYLSEGGYSIGSLEEGLDIKNPQLYKLAYAPLCRNCDAYQCKRCIWLNRKTTLEVNTPSHEQCVVAHLERNASRESLLNIRKHGTVLSEKEEIREIDYLDPFEVRKEW